MNEIKKTDEQKNTPLMDFLQAQKEMKVPAKDAINPFHKSKYASLASVIFAVKEALNKNNIIIIQKNRKDDAGMYIETILLHKNGTEVASDKLYLLLVKQDMQSVGSAITYARRYSLLSLCCLAAEDDDGNSTIDRANRKIAEKEKREKETYERLFEKAIKYLQEMDTDEIIQRKGFRKVVSVIKKLRDSDCIKMSDKLQLALDQKINEDSCD